MTLRNSNSGEDQNSTEQQLKLCRHCGYRRPLSDFYRDRSRPTGVTPSCKFHIAERKRIRRATGAPFGSPDDLTRFYEKVVRIPQPRATWVPLRGPCLVWSAGTTSRDYGCILVNGQSEAVHRIAFELRYGPIPPGMVVDHLCCRKACVNPDHLEAVTVHENNRRAREMKKRQQRSACSRRRRKNGGDDAKAI